MKGFPVRKLHLSLLPALLLALALGLSACGGGGGNDESKIEEAIEMSASTNPVACAKYQTQNFIEQTSEGSGEAAIKKCEEEAKNGKAPEAASVSNVEVDGSQATAEAALTGSILDGQSVEIALVKEGDQWKMNELVQFTKFNQAKLVESFERELAKASNEVSPKFAACFVEAFRQADQGEIEAMLLGGNEKAFEEIAGGCS
jgi:hypothetical protein